MRRRKAGRLVVGLVAVLAGAFWLAAPAASAHPLGNFTVNRYTGLLVSPDAVVVDHVVDLAEIPTAQLGRRIDDLDGLAEQECTRTGQRLQVRVADRLLKLVLERAVASTSPGQGGLPITRVTCGYRARAALGDYRGSVSFADRSAPGVVGWREVTAAGDRMTLTSSDVPADSVSRRLSAYPSDLLSSPLDVTTATLTVAPGGPAGSLPGTSRAATALAPTSALASRAATLLDRSGLLAAVLAIGVALLLGATHALAPGHGKTVMAFYLSQRGDSSWRAALSVGSTVTAAHTGSVLALGVLVTVSTQVVPARLYPWLTLVTGALVVALGVSLLRAAPRGGHDHAHGHDGAHGHDHGHGHGHGHDHDHGHGHGHGHDHGHGHGHGHAHVRGGAAPAGAAPTVVTEPLGRGPGPQPRPGAGGPGRWGLWAMGLVGGLVPSPSALLLLLAAVALGRAWFGVVLVVAFGVGMATTLAVAGLAARDLLSRVERLAASRARLAGPVRGILAYGAAAGVCLAGLGIVARTLMTLA